MIWAQVSQMGASQVKAPTGSIFQKCVYSSLIVKMRNDFGSFGLFVSFLVGDNVWGKNLSNLNFWVPEVRSSNLEVQKILGAGVEMAPYLRKYKYLVKEVYWWNVVCCMECWVVTFNFWFLKISIWFFGEAKVRVKKSFWIENLKMDIGQFFQ